jgi:hypothetical protein
MCVPPQLIGWIILLIWACTKGTDGPNSLRPGPAGQLGTN